jgi:hypothetical protein
MRKIWGLMFIILCLLFVNTSVNAAEVDMVLAFIKPFMEQYAEKFPWLSTIVSVVGLVRVVIKPLMSAMVTINADLKKQGHEVNPLQKLEDVSHNKIYKSVAYVMDWFLSIKLPKKEEEKK